MSHIQNFKFETDSLEDFEKMLEVIVHCLFRHQNSEYTKLHLKAKEPSHWDDGSEYKWTDKAILQTGQRNCVIEPFATYAGAKQYKVTNEYITLEDAAKEASHCDKLPPTRLWIATLSDSNCGFNKDHYCGTKSQMINKAIHATKNVYGKRKNEFDALREPDWMTNGDGSIGTGFRMAVEWDCGAQVLALSLCHIYYGK